jgi:hypothetical protein
VLGLPRSHAGKEEIGAQAVSHITQRHAVVKTQRQRLVEAQPRRELQEVAVDIRRTSVDRKHGVANGLAAATPRTARIVATFAGILAAFPACWRLSVEHPDAFFQFDHIILRPGTFVQILWLHASLLGRGARLIRLSVAPERVMMCNLIWDLAPAHSSRTVSSNYG